MQVAQQNTLLQIQIPSHREDILKVFKDLVDVFKGEVEIKEKKEDETNNDDIMDKYIGKFSGEFKDLTSKDMFYKRANKI